jgi:Holliday junction resolvase-like predicted endonuclease
LRDIIRLKEGFQVENLVGYCTARAAKSYLTSLASLGLVSQDVSGTWRLARPTVTSFGETLEWFVAEVLSREFFAETMHSVSFRMPPPGGDYDVIACMEGILIFIEVKSSPPRGIEIEEVRAFLERREILTPHVSLFLVDTHLRMRDKMVPIFEELLGGIPRDESGPPKKIQRLEREIFHVGHRLYVLNTSRGILSNLKCCFMDYLRRGNPATTFRE